MEIPPLAEVRRLTEKKRDAWWTVFLVDPVATPLVRWTAMRTRLTPNQITWGALFLGLGAAACFALADWKWLIIGAVLYHFSFILDCMDGKLARLTGKGSEFGGWLDYIFDRVRVVCCAAALMGGQFYRTDNPVYMWLALAVIFLDALRYLDALQIFKVRHGMRKKIQKRLQAVDSAKPHAFMEDLLRERSEDETQAEAEARSEAEAETEAEADAETGASPRILPAQWTGPDAVRPAATVTAHAADPADQAAQDAQDADPAPGRVIDLQETFKKRFGPYAAFRDFLISHRVRPHLISGIEFQMAVFIIAPLTGAIIGTTIAAAALLLIFEFAIIYKLLLSTRDFEHVMADLEEEARSYHESDSAAPPLQTSMS
ncbi:CDP-alcohol phosphatidyltransferase family protein [Streptomyces sp. NPDC026673]|uniref:CDP-alcohol phosphatidyltransferase family protein n=1 Tax=Streptomyces sp. NPDC026673 TaxID=3155724 RepID=UPI0033C4CB47